MPLFSTNSAIIFLKKDSLLLLTQQQAPQQLVFPPETVRHQEVVDQKLFEKVLTDFFMKLAKYEATLILGEDVIFQKQLPLGATPEDVQSFYDTIPFPQSQIAKKTIKTSKNMFLLATNRDLYQTVVHITKQQQWELKEVLPLTIFMPYLQSQALSFQTLTNALKHREFANTANFLKEETTEKKEKEPTNAVPLKQYFILIGCVLFLVIALGAAAINLGFIPNPSQTPIVPTNAPHQSKQPALPTSTVAPTEPVKEKKDLTVQIVNGSGITGQAALVKEHITSLGYTNTQIGNTNIASSSSTIVFAKSVNSRYTQEIVTELQTLFITVTAQSTAANSGYDVIIVTGGNVK